MDLTPVVSDPSLNGVLKCSHLTPYSEAFQSSMLIFWICLFGAIMLNNRIVRRKYLNPQDI